MLTLCILFYCLDYYFRISPSLVVPLLKQQYQADSLGLGAFASAFYLGYVLMQLPAGLLLDRCRIHMVMVPSILLCTIAFILFVYSQNYWLGYGLRWAIGGASALSFIGVLYVAKHYLPAHWFGLISGLTIAAGTLSASVAQVVTAEAMQWFHWQYIFTVLACWGVVVSVLLLLPSLRLPEAKHKRIAQPVPWSQLWALTRHKLFLLNAIIGGMFYLPTTIFAALWGIPFLKQSYQFSTTQASMGITVLFIGWAVGSPIIGYLSDRLHRYQFLMSGCSLLAALCSVALIYLPIGVSGGVWLLLFLFGLFSSAQVVVWKAFRDYCPKEIVGTGVAMTNMIIMIFSALCHLLVGWLLQSGMVRNCDHSVDYAVGLSLIPISFICVFLLSFLISRR